MTEPYCYTIADHYVVVRFLATKNDGRGLMRSWEPFLCAADDTRKPLFSLTVDDDMPPVEREHRHRIRVFDTGNGDIVVDRTEWGGHQFIIKDLSGRSCALLIANSDFTECSCALNGTYLMRHFGLNNALMLCFAFAAAPHQTIMLHASVVRRDGRAYAFTAKSGTGKSTQVSMWLRYLPGCDLINDDNPIIRIIDHTPYIYGSPWSGKTPCYRNTRAPLGAIATIVRDDHNHTEPLSAILAFSALLNGCAAMKWDEGLYRACCDVVQQIVETTKIFALHCLPNREAAEVCYEECVREELGVGSEESQVSSEELGVGSEELGGSAQPEVPSPSLSPTPFYFRNEELLPEVVALLEQGHTVTLPLRGISMRPFLEDQRDKALLVKAISPKVGDPVLAEIAPRTYVLHRLVRLDGDHATLLGDGNLTPEHCRLSDIRAVATAFYRKGRTTPDRTDALKWRTYSYLWTRLRPLRRYLLFIYKLFK